MLGLDVKAIWERMNHGEASAYGKTFDSRWRFSRVVYSKEDIFSGTACRYNEKWFSITRLVYEASTSWSKCIYTIYWYIDHDTAKWYCGYAFKHQLEI